ncbi:ABC transporter permease [Nocardia cyriacigeorgica]|uniref:Transporter n=1 Tax=Nocardia cyriacigeorgica (strain GUH-2) TaxID=1127134 RepID=H6R8H0_NOCCG|nr:ABC transporter permease [Nocardia cyriacigeorgica]MBF6287622.1 ABC transporter permease [Nocardia cyriacigeorgica]MBF6425310.1 ABC transporter permease [Nocardia cyriacigeorgica]CCF66117.1 transporter [Nocardia cyriacigeorgica GUH-2]
MNPRTVAIRAGFRRAGIELRMLFTNGEDLGGILLSPILLLTALFFMRNSTFQDTDLKLGALALPGVIGSVVAFNGLYGIAQYLVLDREDGTLLRAKATPNGMIGYLIGKLGANAGSVLAQVAILLGVGMVIVGGVSLDSVGPWLTLVWVLALGLLAISSLGAIIGSIFDDPRGLFFFTMPLMGLVAISGIFYPITGLPGWLQVVGQVFPMYWLGLGMRSALLPDGAQAVELEGSWRHLETAAVLGIWSAAALLIAPIVMRRMARRESGAAMAERREKALQRAY